jgi:hypothetical protein
MFVMLILFLAAYLVFFARSRSAIYEHIDEKMWEDTDEIADLTVHREPIPGVSQYMKVLLYSHDTNKRYEDFLYYSMPVVGDWYWWRNIGRPRLGI